MLMETMGLVHLSLQIPEPGPLGQALTCCLCAEFSCPWLGQRERYHHGGMIRVRPAQCTGQRKNGPQARARFANRDGPSPPDLVSGLLPFGGGYVHRGMVRIAESRNIVSEGEAKVVSGGGWGSSSDS